MAYGQIAAPDIAEPLPILSYTLPDRSILTTHAVHGGRVDAGVIDVLYTTFSLELEDGKTYPQEGPMTRDEFVAYFFGAATIIAIVSPSTVDPASLTSFDAAVAGRPWLDCVAGCYYIKPNYPGRSSHNCNAGFLVAHAQRGRKIGNALAKSYLTYAPALGYRGSVFNLVYKTSLRLWDELGFQRVGVIPNAGRLKTGPGGTEEYVDAIVVYKSFV